MSTTYEERKIVTIHGPVDANVLHVFCRASIEVAAVVETYRPRPGLLSRIRAPLRRAGEETR